MRECLPHFLCLFWIGCLAQYRLSEAHVSRTASGVFSLWRCLRQLCAIMGVLCSCSAQTYVSCFLFFADELYAAPEAVGNHAPQCGDNSPS